MLYSLWHVWGLTPVVSFLMAVHVVLGNWFILELALAVIVGKSNVYFDFIVDEVKTDQHIAAYPSSSARTLL
jgi:hypothetical protein